MLKKDYFPTAKAPDIAKQTVMQYVYGNKKNLTKRFHFYKIYAPAFVLLFIFLWWLVFYNREIKQNNNIYTVVKDYKADQKALYMNENWAIESIDQDIWAWQADYKTDQNIDNQRSNIQETNNVYEIPSNVPMVKWLDDNIEIDDRSEIDYVAKPDDSAKTDYIAEIDYNTDKNVLSTESSIMPIDYTTDTLDQQINEIENLINDISSIISQEEILF